MSDTGTAFSQCFRGFSVPVVALSCALFSAVRDTVRDTGAPAAYIFGDARQQPGVLITTPSVSTHVMVPNAGLPEAPTTTADDPAAANQTFS